MRTTRISATTMATSAQIYKHPYMWNVEITWGTKDEMLKNKIPTSHVWKNQVIIGGSFNKEMRNGSRAALVLIGVELHDNNNDASIQYCPWEGTYHYLDGLFDKNLEQGIYPISLDWDGKTYIVDKYVNGVQTYRLTDTYRY